MSWYRQRQYRNYGRKSYRPTYRRRFYQRRAAPSKGITASVMWEHAREKERQGRLREVFETVELHSAWIKEQQVRDLNQAALHGALPPDLEAQRNRLNYEREEREREKIAKAQEAATQAIQME